MPPTTYQQFGTLSVFDTLAAQASSQTVAAFGEDRVFETIARGFQIHNNIARGYIAGRVEFTNDRLRRYGGAPYGDMERLDEFGIPDAQKRVTGENLGLPLDYYGYAIQWTRKFLQSTLVEDLLKEAQAARIAHIRRVQNEILRAEYKATNTLDYNDELVNPKLTLPVRGLLNADGTPIPPNPYNGQEFDPTTHTHYLFATSVTDAAITALIKTVTEHGVEGTIQLEVPELLEPAVRALTGFVAQIQANIQLGGGSTVTIATGNLETINTANRKIGVYGAAEVWVKPFSKATAANRGWITCRDTGARYLGFRTRPGVTPVNLIVEYENENFPLRARVLTDEFGVAVVRREKAAILYVAPDAIAYVAPDIS